MSLEHNIYVGSVEEPYILSKEPYILSKEPYILSKEPCILSKEPYILSKEPCILSKEPCILSKEPYILSKEPYILSKEPCILSKEPCILSKEPLLQKSPTFSCTHICLSNITYICTRIFDMYTYSTCTYTNLPISRIYVHICVSRTCSLEHNVCVGVSKSPIFYMYIHKSTHLSNIRTHTSL